ncbi:MAG: energy-coupling factor transporter transmembrane component T [Candidatus Vecturithrix sp.]|jgi:energy-coupling factor transport system permease protein|nr:energy-coupling factor transporter transmembrane component T [Candidatus Vecturithrix sp.]
MRLDPRTAFLTTVMLILATVRVRQGTTLLLISGVLLLVLLITRTPIRLYARNLALLAWFLAFTFFACLWGEGSADPGENIGAGVQAIGRVSVIVGWATILGNSVSPLALINGLEHLLRPLNLARLPVSRLSIVAMLSLRFIPVLFQQSQHLRDAYIARGIEIQHGNFMTRLKTAVFLCGPLFSSLLRRVEHLALAMESRAFQAETARTLLHELRMRWYDYLVLAAGFSILVFVMSYE